MKRSRVDVINSYIQEKGEVKITELSELYPDISSMTIRRDIEYLEKEGLIVRTKGGAKSIEHLSNLKEKIYSLRANENITAKINIAQKALNFMNGVNSIYMDSGTTTMALSRIIPNKNMLVLTSGANVGLELLKKSNINVILTGGIVNRDTLSVSGHRAIEIVNTINIEVAFLATSGFSLSTGFSCGNFDECELKRTVIKRAQKTVLLIDSSKINKNMPYTFADLNDIDYLICEEVLSDEVKEAAKSAGTEIL